MTTSALLRDQLRRPALQALFTAEGVRSDAFTLDQAVVHLCEFGRFSFDRVEDWSTGMTDPSTMVCSLRLRADSDTVFRAHGDSALLAAVTLLGDVLDHHRIAAQRGLGEFRTFLSQQ